MPDWPSYDLLYHRANTTPEQTAVIDTDTDTTYDWSTLNTRVGRLATTLEAYVDPGDRVAVIMDTSAPFVQTTWAITRVGGIVVPLNPDRPPAALHNRIDETAVTCLICSSPTHPLLDTGIDLDILSWDPPTTDDIAHLKPANRPRPPTETTVDTDQFVLFTSGTTGDPKPVRLTTKNLLTNAIGAAIRLGSSPRDRWLDCLPIYHMGGLAPIVRTALYGSTLLLQSGFDLDATPHILNQYDATGVSMVPTMLYRLLESDWEPPSALDTVLLGGAPAGTPLLERALDAGVPVSPTYGLTETASQVATATPDTVADDPESVGSPLIVTDVTIVDDGRVCPPGEPGEIHVAGPTVTPGYLDAETTNAAMTDYGLATGDIGVLDETGYLTVYGRIDDQILTGGETVAPQKVVDVLDGHEDIVAAAVVGIDDQEWGEQVAALVVPTTDSSLRADDINQYASDQLAPFEIPRTIEFTEALPRTESGTIDRDAVTATLAGGDGQV